MEFNLGLFCPFWGTEYGPPQVVSSPRAPQTKALKRRVPTARPVSREFWNQTKQAETCWQAIRGMGGAAPGPAVVGLTTPDGPPTCFCLQTPNRLSEVKWGVEWEGQVSVEANTNSWCWGNYQHWRMT